MRGEGHGFSSITMTKSMHIFVILAVFPVAVYSTKFSWSPWINSDQSCPRKCSVPRGMWPQHRKCWSCADDACKEKTEAAVSNCPGSLVSRRTDCYEEDCTGKGFFTGFWTEWAQTDKTCPPPAKKCRPLGSSLDWRRKCMKGKHSGKRFACGWINRVGSSKYEMCPCGMTKEEKVGWREWSEWKCPEDCKNGTSSAIRVRSCVADLKKSIICEADEKGLRDEEKVPCIKEDGSRLCPEHAGTWGRWARCTATCGESTTTRTCGNALHKRTCPGEAKMVKACPSMPPCPRRDGGWSDWGSWSSCTAVCGWGVRSRERKCDNPAPSGAGRQCGNPKETVGCKLEADCPVDENIYMKTDGQSVELKCHKKFTTDLVDAFKMYNPKIHWMKNGKLVVAETGRVEMGELWLNISNLSPGDSGAYACQVQYMPDTSSTISIFSLAVESDKPTLTVNEGQSVSMPCNGLMLSVVHPSIKHAWLHNGKVMSDDSNVEQKSVDVQTIEAVKPSDAGIWACIWKAENSHKVWTTNWIRLKVKKSASEKNEASEIENEASLPQSEENEASEIENEASLPQSESRLVRAESPQQDEDDTSADDEESEKTSKKGKKGVKGIMEKVKKLPGGVIGVSVVAGVVALLLIIICCVFYKKGKNKEAAKLKEAEEAETQRLLEEEKEKEEIEEKMRKKSRKHKRRDRDGYD